MIKNIQLAWDLYHSYENYKENKLTNRRFKHADIIPLIEQLKNKNIFRVNKVGESFQNRDIFSISIGNGQKKILCWSQMHGDEPTATAAIFDIFKFFLAEEHFREVKDYLLNNVTLYFLPMLNPDGAEMFERRNSQRIDLNRDASKQESPEAKILYGLFNSVRPDFGFNMHDQDRDYSAGYSKKYPALSFLAPASDYDGTVNESRTKSMLLIGEIYNILSGMVPGHLSRYPDDYEPRSFGDTFMSEGSSIVLFESGVWHGDREKQFIRRLNFISILIASNSIAGGYYLKEDIDTYHLIPENKRLMMDFIIRKVQVVSNGKSHIIDVGINYEEINIPGSNEFYYKAKIKDLGDLSVFSGINEFDASGLNIESGKTSMQIFNSIDEINNLDIVFLLDEGITNVRLSSNDLKLTHSFTVFNVILNQGERTEELREDTIPNFILRKDGVCKYAVINGFLIAKNNPARSEGNSLIFR